MTSDPSVKRYRKKPVAIEAMQLPTDGDIARYVEIADWLSGVGAARGEGRRVVRSGG